MINRLLVCILIFTLILISSIAVISQNKVEERADLAQVIIEQAQLFSFAESEIENVKVIVYQFQGTAEEAIKYAEETLFENDSKKPEMVFSQDNLVSVLRFFRAFAEQGIVPALDEDW